MKPTFILIALFALMCGNAKAQIKKNPDYETAKAEAKRGDIRIY